MIKAIVLKDCINGVVAMNRIDGAFDVGIELDNCEGINTYGNDINIFSPVRNVTKRSFGRKVGRNEKCPCHSGLKFKKCCGG
ncbi:TPA: SEC-C metal-binding domain-containing protein [Aeromonas veronii]